MLFYIKRIIKTITSEAAISLYCKEALQSTFIDLNGVDKINGIPVSELQIKLTIEKCQSTVGIAWIKSHQYIFSAQEKDNARIDPFNREITHLSWLKDQIQGTCYLLMLKLLAVT